MLVTRSENDAPAFSQQIALRGGIPVSVPLIGFRPAALDASEMNKLSNLKQYDWLIFTSQKGVEYFSKLVPNNNLPQIAAIGEKTESSLRLHGMEPAFIPSQFVAERFAEEFPEQLDNHSNILIVKGNLARDMIAKKLEEEGHLCDEIVIYENSLPSSSEKRLKNLLEKGTIDIVTFTSSSTVRHFMEVVNKNQLQLGRMVYACIGPIAAKTAGSYGLPVAVIAEPYTSEGLLSMLDDYIQ
ncbi:uroporphyrinogen-III synthase [Bacillus sp. 1P06AnD]|uniref:uroporphyrinogen-III synthase n=1 Tax=Bacillus sp. 1P06AnD TaxID=3132208 RepID=UPI0039A2748B